MTISQFRKDDSEDGESTYIAEEEFDNESENLSLRGNAQANKARIRYLQRQIERLKMENRLKIQEVIAKHRQEKLDWERLMRDQIRVIHENYEREYARLNKDHQNQLEQVKEIYTTQITQILQILKNSVDSQVLTAKESMAARQSADRGQVDDLKKWMMQEFTNKITKYKDIMDSIETDEANKAALASGKDIGILIGGDTKTNKRKTIRNNENLNPDRHSLPASRQTDEFTNEKLAKHHVDTDQQLEALKDHLRDVASRPRKSGPTKKGGLASLFKGFATN